MNYEKELKVLCGKSRGKFIKIDEVFSLGWVYVRKK